MFFLSSDAIGRAEFQVVAGEDYGMFLQVIDVIEPAIASVAFVAFGIVTLFCGHSLRQHGV